MQRLLLTTCLLLPLLALSYSAHAETSKLRVVTQSLRTTALISELELSGTLRPLRESSLSVSADALVKRLHVDAGSRVKRGDLLLELDSNIAKQEHQRARAQLSAAETTALEATRLRDEATKLKQQNHIAQSEVSARESAAKLAAAKLEEARADARIAAEHLARHRLYAPFDGVISARWTDLGQWLNRGDQVFTLVSMDLLRLDVQLPQEHLPNIEHIKAVQIRPDSRPDLHLPAHVDTLVPVGDASRSFLLRLASNETSPTLLPGASARAHLQFEHSQSAVLLPRDAVLRNADGNFSVFVVEQGKALRRQVELGLSGRDGYLIENGLQAGEQVVIRGNELLTDGQPVAVTGSTAAMSDEQGQNHD
jgi:RND family efflux transporter MFP subunit